MSTTLYWNPVVRGDDNGLPLQLKSILVDHESYLNGSSSCEMCRVDLSYLRGLNDAGVEGASELMAAIGKYGAIELRLR